MMKQHEGNEKKLLYSHEKHRESARKRASLKCTINFISTVRERTSTRALECMLLAEIDGNESIICMLISSIYFCAVCFAFLSTEFHKDGSHQIKGFEA